MIKVIGLLFLLLSFSGTTATLHLENGIDLFTINGKKVEKVSMDAYELQSGLNQISVQFAAKLKKSGKLEYISTKPYLVSIDIINDSDVKPNVVTVYNRKHGIIFSSTGAENLTEEVVKVTEDGKITISGDALAQLKLWYSKASEDEIEQFEMWVTSQE